MTKKNAQIITPFFYSLYEIEEEQAEKEKEEDERKEILRDYDSIEEYEREMDEVVAKEEAAEAVRRAGLTSEERAEEDAEREYRESLLITKETAAAIEHTRTDYCKEDNFEKMVLNKLFPGEKWEHNKTIPKAPRRTRPDFRCERLKLIVEYNGHRHYTQARTILADAEKKKMYEKMGYTVIEWPYWLQPDKNTVRVLFCGLGDQKPRHYCDFHQGFMSKDCVLPADFCSLGTARYNYELSCQEPETILQVDWSLRNKEALYGTSAVFPTKGLACEDYYAADGTRHWWRKVHSFSFVESMEIGQSIF